LLKSVALLTLATLLQLTKNMTNLRIECSNVVVAVLLTIIVATVAAVKVVEAVAVMTVATAKKLFGKVNSNKFFF